MHWNLLGQGASGKTRVGYVWMEFRRVGDDGTEHWSGCGARLHASVHTTTAHADYFTTTARIAHPDGIHLVNDTGQPLTKAALTEALRDRGEVHPSATDYRTTVRRELFAGMGEQRYESLLSALLQLRQPKLSERLDPSLLSTLLSRALPPLGEGEITELAEGFERLDRQRDHLDRLDAEVAAAENVASRQRAYARRVLRSGAASLISATTEMDDLTRNARVSAEEYEKACEERASTLALREELELRAHALDEIVEGLRESDAYQKGRSSTGFATTPRIRSRPPPSCVPPPGPPRPRRSRTGSTPTRSRATPARATSTPARPRTRRTARPEPQAWRPFTTR